jgi:RNA polymerase sigma-70 factor (ECF subfamily)
MSAGGFCGWAGSVTTSATAAGAGDIELEAALILRAQAGDTDAFGALVARHMRQAYFSAVGLVGSREDALHLSQEAFARAFRARQQIDPTRPFYAWYYTILRRLCFNWLRDRRTARARLDEAAPWLEALAQAQVEDPARALERGQARRRLAAAMAALSELEREALVLKEFEGLKYREIAERLGIPIGTVMSRLYAARQRLADALEAR